MEREVDVEEKAVLILTSKAAGSQDPNYSEKVYRLNRRRISQSMTLRSAL